MTPRTIALPFAVLLILFALWSFFGWVGAGVGALFFGIVLFWALAPEGR